MTTTQPSTPTQPSGMDRFFASLHAARIRRGRGGVVGGVCSGLAQHLNLAPVIVRLGAVLLAFTGIGLAAYLLAWLLLPSHDGTIHLERALRDGKGASIALLVITGLIIVPGYDQFGFWAFVGAAALIVLIWQSTKNSSTAQHTTTQVQHEGHAPSTPSTWPTGPQDARH